jgi:serine/threonine protein kinase
MPAEKTCPTCGKTVNESALMGLCPDCLLQAGFGTIDTGQDALGKSAAFAPPTPMEWTRYFPDLEIIELLGRGGMGAVYKARQKRLERQVALKILPPTVGQDPSFAERFEREAIALAQLHHPNIVTLYDSGQVDGLFYFFMEFVDGVNLRQLLDGGCLSSKEALAIVPQICDALQFAHDRGIIHRDIKPENILLSKEGQVKIADFGVAKIVARELTEAPVTDAPMAETDQTEVGKIIGTPQYMAPEQLSHPLDVDNRADIYALGVVFYQMLTGELPAGKFEPPSRKVQIDVRLDEIVLRALEKKPELRYQQASVMKTQVETIAETPGAGVISEVAPNSQQIPRKKESAPVSPPRFSRMAVVGGWCVGFAILAAILITISNRLVSNAVKQEFTFLPETELLITRNDADADGFVFIQMETGKVFKPPFDLKVRPDSTGFVEITPELSQWITANNVDLLLRMPDSSWGLMNLQLQVVDLGTTKDWNPVLPENLIDALAKKDADFRESTSNATSAGFGAEVAFGHSIAFRTRNDVMGVYSMENALDDDHHVLRMRIELLQSTGTSHPKLNETMGLLEQAKKADMPGDSNQAALLNHAWQVLQAEGGHKRYRKHRGYALDAIQSAISTQGGPNQTGTANAIDKALSEIQRALVTAAVFERAQQADSSVPAQPSDSSFQSIPPPSNLTKSSVGVTDSIAAKAPFGGEVVAGLQITAKAEFPAGVIHYWIRNAEDHEITYNRYGLGNWECIGLEVQDPTGSWTQLNRDPSGERATEGLGPNQRGIEKLPAHQVIKNNYPEIALGALGSLRLENLPVPTNLKATAMVDLGDFQWPESILQQSSIAVRIVQSMPGTSDEDFSDLASDAIRSPPIQLDGGTMRNFLESYSPNGRTGFKKSLSDGTTIKTEKGSANDKSVDSHEELHAIDPDRKVVAIGIEPAWAFDATEESEWISVLYRDTTYAMCVATFKIQDGQVIDLSNTQLEQFGPGDRLGSGYFSTPDGIICMRNEPDQKMHSHEWIFSLKGDRPQWNPVIGYDSSISPRNITSKALSNGEVIQLVRRSYDKVDASGQIMPTALFEIKIIMPNRQEIGLLSEESDFKTILPADWIKEPVFIHDAVDRSGMVSVLYSIKDRLSVCTGAIYDGKHCDAVYNSGLGTFNENKSVEHCGFEEQDGNLDINIAYTDSTDKSRGSRWRLSSDNGRPEWNPVVDH